ncbi:MAG TPA: FCD domain-containing protein [Thermoleophilia bacterium]|nr:FCD domain-containing protein [Thermoleophilia bacterium]
MRGEDESVPGVKPVLDLGPLRPRSSSMLVADSLRRLIALGALSPGERLPSERELAETLRVGRDSIRQAIRTLNDEGLVETRLGRSGGTVVLDRPVQPKRLSEEILASHREIRASYEFRLAIEPAAASMAARRATTEDVARITAIADEQAWSFRSWRSIDSRFHAAVAEASGNGLLLDAVQRTRTAFFSWYDAIYSRLPWDSLPIQDRDFAYLHRPIAEAIADGDPERAGLLMKEALEWSEQDLEDLLDGVVAHASARRENVPRSMEPDPAGQTAPGAADARRAADRDG